jgi:hypothetical protein
MSFQVFFLRFLTPTPARQHHALDQRTFLLILLNVSAVDQAIAKVKKLSPTEARELLNWLSNRSAQAVKRSSKPRRKRRAPLSQAQFKKWQDSVRLTTDWEPPRMPNDLVEIISL